MEDAIDIDAIPQEAADNLVHLKKLGPMAEGFISEVNELLDVLNHSVEQAGDTERKIEEIYGEIHFAREQIVAAQKVEEEAIEAKKGLEMSIEQARKKGEEHRAAEAKKEEVADLYKKIEQLKVDVQAGSGWRPDQERTKIRALSEELDRPLNVHRWRHLESSDPSRFEMIRKIQSLQKRLIKKTAEVMEKDSLIAEKEKLYVELKNILGRQPGPEVTEQITLYQNNLKEKHRQMKAMNVELEMYKQQVDAFRSELTGMAADGRALQNEWLKKARKQQAVDQ